MTEEDGQVKNGKQILKQIKDLQGTYESYQVDEAEEDLSFIDKVNKLLQSIMGDGALSVYEAMNNEKLERWKKKRFSRWLKRTLVGNFQNVLYFILLSTITIFLVSEALDFYAIDGLIDTKTYIKAILTEVCFIFLSGYRAAGRYMTIWVNFLRACIFCLMMFVISSQTLSTGTSIISENKAIAQQIVLLESQITDKQTEIEYYISIKWPRNATTSRLAKEALVNKLIKLKDEQASGKNESVSKVEEYKMYGRAAFRVLLLFISVLITRRIFTF